jgi:hypothetical protein
VTRGWPPAEYPLVEGLYTLTAHWCIHLPLPFTKRMEEDGSLVLWRPGLTIWLDAWGNDRRLTQAARLTEIKSRMSPAARTIRDGVDGALTRFSYRLLDQDEEGSVESVYAFILEDGGHLQLAVYFDDLKDEPLAIALVDSVALRARPRSELS